MFFVVAKMKSQFDSIFFLFFTIFSCRLLMVETQNSLGIFEGKPGSLLFSYSQQLLSSNKFYTAGKLIAWSIAHNGPGPRCINRHLFCMMCGQKTSLDDFDVEVFMDEDVKQNIEKVKLCAC